MNCECNNTFQSIQVNTMKKKVTCKPGMRSISGFRCEKMCAKYKNIHWFAFYANREWIEKILHGKEHCCSITGSSTHDNHSKHTAKHYTLHIPVLTLRLIRLTHTNPKKLLLLFLCIRCIPAVSFATEKKRWKRGKNRTWQRGMRTYPCCSHHKQRLQQ